MNKILQCGNYEHWGHAPAQFDETKHTHLKCPKCRNTNLYLLHISDSDLKSMSFTFKPENEIQIMLPK